MLNTVRWSVFIPMVVVVTGLNALNDNLSGFATTLSILAWTGIAFYLMTDGWLRIANGNPLRWCRGVIVRVPEAVSLHEVREWCRENSGEWQEMRVNRWFAFRNPNDGLMFKMVWG